MASALAEDVNVDELRRRARRRLVGAIVLALAAAVIVPMLLESEPRPLGEDVAVKIPPVDDGKFVNRLNDPAAKADKAPASRAPETRTPKAETKSSDAARTAEPAKSADASKAADGPKSAEAPKTAEPAKAADAGKTTEAAVPDVAKATAAVTSPDTPKPVTAAATPVAPPPPATSSTPPAPALRTPAPTSAGAAPPAAANGAFAVQLAAFSDDKGANALAARLKRAGYTAYTEPVKTSKATLWRVRVGPYPSREAANAARDKLKAEGQNGIVAPAH